MIYKLIIFDLDGTIADTSEGILDSHKHTLKIMGRAIPSDTELKKYIGGNLMNIYIENFGFKTEEARTAIDIYRNRYASVGIHKAVLYPEIITILNFLKENGFMLGIATLKIEKFANIMLEEMGVKKYFNYICGMDAKDTLSKAKLIQKCMDLSLCNREQVVVIGDSNNDLIGAQEVGVNFIGVTYGFGFKYGERYAFKTANSILELEEWLKR